MESNKNINTIGMFDLLKGIAMIMIVFAHTILLYDTGTADRIIQRGLLTVFFIAGGYNFKPIKMSKCIQQQVRFIFKPYIVFTIIISILLPIIHFLMYGWLPGALNEGKKQLLGLLLGFSTTNTLLGFEVYGNGPSWFVLTFAFAWILLNMIFLMKNEWLRAIAVSISVIVGFFLSQLGDLPFCISQVLIATGFLHIGYIIRKFKLLQVKLSWYIYLILGALSLLGLFFGNINFIDSLYKLGILDIVCSIAYSFLLIKLCLLTNRFENGMLNVIRTIGRYSFWIMFVHTLEFLCFRWYELTEIIKKPLYGITIIFVLRSTFIGLGCMLWNYISKHKLLKEKRKSDPSQASLHKSKLSDIVFNFTSEVSPGNQSNSIRILYAFSIIFLVNSHITASQSYFTINNLFPYHSFQIALFVFCTGYFYNNEYDNHLLQFIKKMTVQLIVPLILWNLFYGLLSMVLKQLFGFSIGNDLTWKTLLISPLTDGHQFSYNLGSWIIFPLFCAGVINCLARKVLNLIHVQSEWILFLTYLAVGILGNQLTITGHFEGLWISLARVMFFLPCYGFGILYRYKLEDHDRLNNWLYFPAIIVLQMVILVFCNDIQYYPSWFENFLNGPIVPFVTAATGIALWLRIVKILTPVLIKSKAIIAIGDNAFRVIMHQFLGFFICNTLLAVLSKLDILHLNFSMTSYKSDIFYTYYPKLNTHFTMVYILFGITVPLIIGYTCNAIIKPLKAKINFNELKL